MPVIAIALTTFIAGACVSLKEHTKGPPFRKHIIWLQIAALVYSLFCAFLSMKSLNTENFAIDVSYALIYVFLGLSAANDISCKEVEYCFSIPIIIMGSYIGYTNYGAAGIVVVLSTFFILEFISFTITDGIGGADIFLFTGLSGCFRIEYLGCLFMFSALIAISLMFVEKGLSRRVLTENNGIAFVPAILLSVLPVQFLNYYF